MKFITIFFMNIFMVSTTDIYYRKDIICYDEGIYLKFCDDNFKFPKKFIVEDSGQITPSRSYNIKSDGTKSTLADFKTNIICIDSKCNTKKLVVKVIPSKKYDLYVPGPLITSILFLLIGIICPPLLIIIIISALCFAKCEEFGGFD